MKQADLIVYDEVNTISIADLKAAAERLKAAGIKDPAFIIHPSMSLRGKCLAMDPLRGVACAAGLGHAGDHISIAGFPWVNEHFPRPKYEGASEADLAAIEEILGNNRVDDCDDCGAQDCDDCGAKPGEACNPDVEH